MEKIYHGMNENLQRVNVGTIQPLRAIKDVKYRRFRGEYNVNVDVFEINSVQKIIFLDRKNTDQTLNRNLKKIKNEFRQKIIKKKI